MFQFQEVAAGGDGDAGEDEGEVDAVTCVYGRHALRERGAAGGASVGGAMGEGAARISPLATGLERTGGGMC